MARSIATDRIVDREEMLELVRPRHRGVLGTTRRDGRPQMSLVTMGVDTEGRIVISTYPQRAKTRNARRDPEVSVLVMGESFGDEWVQVDGRADVLDVPEAVEPLCDYYRSISGEHPDWDEYRQAMLDQDKSLIRISIDRWSPVSKGGFPAHLVDDD